MVALATMLLLMLPSISSAAGGENVKLNFSNTDKYYLYASLGFGILALVVGFVLRSSVLKQSPGDEKMQEVGGAIREGALAYLRKQIKTMLFFVVIVAIGLFFLYNGKFDATTSAMVSVAFVGGVLASYIAGYVGMDVAVNGNMRTAHAALTSCKKALEVAFRSGAVAGMITVGMGLLGATLIFLFAGDKAMTILVGFGFGGSLAALFMRVGGGIFTKAADVGADLVGKVEAGIPEDDPRNPAVIADNVGDNVGDCAGMAADVFESYEVTLVAAIVLGAATAAIFDAQTWMRLILFALVARGIGVVASIIGIYMVKGSDDVNTDPLKPITKGFMSSAAIAAVLTAVAAYFMMGGAGNPISQTTLKTAEDMRYQEFMAVKAAQKLIADKSHKGDEKLVTADELKKEASLTKYEYDKEENAMSLTTFLTMQRDAMPQPKAKSGYSPVDFSDAKDPVYNYTVQKPTLPAEGQAPPAPEYVKLGDLMKAYATNNKLIVAGIEEVTTEPEPTARGEEAKSKTKSRMLYYGPIDRDIVTKQIEQVSKSRPNVKYSLKEAYAVNFLKNTEGELLAGIGNKIVDGKPSTNPADAFPGIAKLLNAAPTTAPVGYYKEGVDAVKAAIAKQQSTPGSPAPQMLQVNPVLASQNPVEWWRFAACIIFGVLMAFAFERLTDYYVSTHRKPVEEVANVATAGPAPMIIQGFSYACESSVFSVLFIVIALMMPLIIFPAAVYGGFLLSFYGIALVGLGLLTTTGYILAMDTFGPISDNAQGVFEMSGAGHSNPEGAKAVQRLDAAGNTTKALTKGFAIATAVVAAVALFHSYVEGAHLTTVGMPIELPTIFLGLMIGGAAPYLFSAFSINAVGRAAFDLIREVRRQFHSDPGIMAGTSKPDYAACVAIVTGAAQRELLGPGILAIFLPVAVAFGFSMAGGTTMVNGVEFQLNGAQALGGFLAGTIVSGQLLAVVLANSGGMWDNAKKLIEDGLHGGKGTEAHKAGVVCDTVGDPFKDTAGPALNPLIKVMNLVALLLAPIIVKPFPTAVSGGITLVAVALLAVAFYLSKKGSMSSSMDEAKAE